MKIKNYPTRVEVKYDNKIGWIVLDQISLKKKALEEKFGMKLSGTHENVSPDVESQWLDFIREFEEQFERNETATN